MPHFSNAQLEVAVYCGAAVLLLVLGYAFGRAVASFGHRRHVSSKEQDLFTAHRAIKSLYEQELAAVRSENVRLSDELAMHKVKVDEYRKKAAGLGGMFTFGAKRASAMHQMLMENEALEEALHNQNEKLRDESAEGLRERLRAIVSRRVLVGQMLNNGRKNVPNDVIQNQPMRTAPPQPAAALPSPDPTPAAATVQQG